MTWTKLGDDFTDRPEMFEVSRSARLLLVEMYVWSNRMLRDGRVPVNVLRRISDSDDTDVDVKELVGVGLVDRVDDGALQLDWSDQDDAAEVKARKEYRADTQKRYRQRKARHDRGDHGACDNRYCKSATGRVTGNATSNGDGHVSGYETPSRPVPSRPKDRGQGQDGAVAGSAGATPAPRLVVDGERLPPGFVPTPWDVEIEVNDCDPDDHYELWIGPILHRASADGWTETEVDAGFDSFVVLARDAATVLERDIASTISEHGCAAGEENVSKCGVRTSLLDEDDDPVLIVLFPKAFVSTWLERARLAFRDAPTHLEEK